MLRGAPLCAGGMFVGCWHEADQLDGSLLRQLLTQSGHQRLRIASARASQKLCYQSLRIKEEKEVMAKTIARRKRVVRRDWTRADVKELRQHSRDKTRVKTISKVLKRTPGSLRQKARALGIPLGHRRPKKKRA